MSNPTGKNTDGNLSRAPEKKKSEIELLRKKHEQEILEFTNLLHDAALSAKLNEWEKEFIRGMKKNNGKGLYTRMKDLSEKQQEVMKRIEIKIYAIG